MFQKLGHAVVSHPWLVLLAWVSVALLVGCIAPAWEERCVDDDLDQLPAHCTSLAGYHLLREAFPAEALGSRVIFAFERATGPLSSSDFALVDQVIAALQGADTQRPGSVLSYRDPVLGPRLVSADRRCTLIVVSLDTPFLALKTAEQVQELERRIQPLLGLACASGSGLRVVTTGTAGMGRDLNDAALRSIDDTTLATVILVVVILLLLYRAPLLAIVPLVTIAGSVWISLRLLSLLTLIPDFQVVHLTRVFVVVVLYGAGTDYCMFLISRYREELHGGRRLDQALSAALGRVGGALTASAATVVCGLGMMGFADFAKLRCTGPAIALSLLVALLAALTLTPALLRIMGTRVFWPWGLSPACRRGLPENHSFVRRAQLGFWVGLSRLLDRYPARVWIGTVLALLPLAVIGGWTQATSRISDELPQGTQGRAGLRLIEQHFAPGELGPLTVLLQTEEPWTSAAGRELLEQTTHALRGLNEVADVRSLLQPLGRAATSDAAPIGGLVHGLAAQRYLAQVPSGHVTRLEVVFRDEPFSAQSAAGLMRVRARLGELFQSEAAPPVQLAMFGITTVASDIDRLQASDRLLVNSLVTASVLVILLVLVRRPFVAVYLLASVLFSYVVALGAAEVLALGWIDGELGMVDWKVPFFLFVILVAIGADYNIFLMARVLEESRDHGPHEGTLRALRFTGGTISACGLIMAGTFATLMLCQMTTLMQLGLALTIGVLLDTFVVRTVLVPAFLLLVSRDQAEMPRGFLRRPFLLLSRIGQATSRATR